MTCCIKRCNNSPGRRRTLTLHRFVEKLIVILFIKQFSTNDPLPSHDTPLRSVGVVKNDAWSTKAHEWDVC